MFSGPDLLYYFLDNGMASAVADRWSLLAAEAKRKGKAWPIIDGLLAATALHHNLTVVSRNASDFAYARVPVLNPWQA